MIRNAHMDVCMSSILHISTILYSGDHASLGVFSSVRQPPIPPKDPSYGELANQIQSNRGIRVSSFTAILTALHSLQQAEVT